MTEPLCINQAVYSELETLTKFWCFKRKTLAAAITVSLEGFEKQVAQHVSQMSLNFQQQLQKQETLHNEEIKSLNLRYQNVLSQQKTVLTTEICALEAKYSEQKNTNGRLFDQVKTLNEQVMSTKVLLTQNRAHLQVLEELKQELDDNHQQLQQDYTQLHHENLTLNDRFALVQSILSAKPSKNEGIDAFYQLLHNDYSVFAAEESSLADEAGAFLALQKILTELEHVNAFPAYLGKTVIGVAGGFSSGKSEFINSFIKDKSLRLATGLNPVTVIPSFVVCAPRSRICGYANNGGIIRLSNDIYKALSHDYVSAFGFDLRSIMPTISLQAPMDEALFEHICLVDTPGYNPGVGVLAESSDKSATIRYLEHCSAMIWVIGLDPAGTIPQSDIDFISQQSFTKEDLYIVLNKADVKSQEDIQSIMEMVADTLFCYRIDYAGMCAYSSTRSEYYAVKGASLEGFLKSRNRIRNISSDFEAKIDSVFTRYDTAIRSDIDDIQRLQTRIKELQLSTLKDSGSRALKDLMHVTDFFRDQLANEESLAQLLQKSHDLRKSFKDAVNLSIAEMSPVPE